MSNFIKCDSAAICANEVEREMKEFFGFIQPSQKCANIPTLPCGYKDIGNGLIVPKHYELVPNQFRWLPEYDYYVPESVLKEWTFIRIPSSLITFPINLATGKCWYNRPSAAEAEIYYRNEYCRNNDEEETSVWNESIT